MAMCRLSIQGSLGNLIQPIFCKCGRITLIYNGEIYNWREIAQSHGILTPNCSDGDILAELICRYSDRAFGMLRGMFAIVCFDARIQRWKLVRDFFGMKPLYISKYKSSLRYSSEIRALVLSDSKKKWSICEIGKNYFLSFGHLPPNCSGIQEIEIIQSNFIHCFDVSGNLVYKNEIDNSLLKDERQKNIKDSIYHSTKLHLESDTPIALMLSGGIDSALIAKNAQIMGKKLFCINLNSQVENRESTMAEIIANTFGHEFIEVNILKKD